MWLARPRGAPARRRRCERGRSGGWRTSLVFWGAGAEQPGWLVRCLQEFAGREINLTKIESRPRREELGRYMFFADLAGARTRSRVAEALAGLAELCEQVRVLGSYRAATAAGASAERTAARALTATAR